MKIDRLNLDVTIGGNTVRPSLVRMEQYAEAVPCCEVVLSGEHRQLVNSEDHVVVSLDDRQIFSGRPLADSTIPGGMVHRFGYELSEFSANFRQEQASYIFDYLASQSGIDRYQGDIPDVQLPHFHCTGAGWKNLLGFADMLTDWSINDTFDVYFDCLGVLHLHPIREFDEISAEFQRGKNAFLITDKVVKAFPMPLGYGQSIKVNGRPQRIEGLRYLITPDNSMMEVLF